MLPDYSDWIITIPLADAKELFPTFADGCDAGASVARFNAMFLDRAQEAYPNAWINQEKRSGIDANGPEMLMGHFSNNIEIDLEYIKDDIYEKGDWYVLS